MARDLCVQSSNTKFRSIPNPEKRHILGLAFNPSSPNAHFDLICLYRIPNCNPTEYGFDVFTSSRGVWTESKKRVTISSKCVTGRSYCAGGLLHFRAENDAAWFDPDKDLAGVIKLPISNEPKSSALCVYENRLCYTQATTLYVKIWTLNDNWERRYSIRLGLIDFASRNNPHWNKTSKRRSMRYVVHRNLDRNKIKELPLVLDGLFMFRVGAEVYSYRIHTCELSEFHISDEQWTEHSICVPYIIT